MRIQLALDFDPARTPCEKWHAAGYAGTFSDWMDWRVRDFCPLYVPR